MRLADVPTEKHGFESKQWSPGAKPYRCLEKEDVCSRENPGWTCLLVVIDQRILEEEGCVWKVRSKE